MWWFWIPVAFLVGWTIARYRTEKRRHADGLQHLPRHGWWLFRFRVEPGQDAFDTAQKDYCKCCDW